MEMTHDQFLEDAKETFGDKIRVDRLHIDEGQPVEKLGLTKKAIEEYPAQAWLTCKDEQGYDLCPDCEARLNGIFGTFQWGLAHGYGICGACKKVEFQLYHFLGESEERLELLSVSGFVSRRTSHDFF